MSDRLSPTIFSPGDSTFLQPWRWRQYVPPKRWYLPSSLHGVKTRKNVTTMRTHAVMSTMLGKQPRDRGNYSAFRSTWGFTLRGGEASALRPAHFVVRLADPRDKMEWANSSQIVFILVIWQANLKTKKRRKHKYRQNIKHDNYNIKWNGMHMSGMNQY
jgi:hypothetical protein